MDVLPQPKVLDLEVLSTRQHRLGPAMLHLLAKCSHLEKLRIDISPLNSVNFCTIWFGTLNQTLICNFCV
jgi:hypothetical protein